MTRILAVISLVFSMHVAAQTPISVHDLFNNNDNISTGLSPSGSHVVSLDVAGDTQSITLIDPVSQKAFVVLEVDNDASLKIEQIEWIDENNIFVSLSQRKGILKLIYEENKVIGEWQYVEANGYLVNGMENHANMLLFAHKPDRAIERVKLYFISPDQLVSGTFDAAKRFNVELEKAYHYFYDEINQTLLTFIVKSEHVEFWIFENDVRTWERYFEIYNGINFSPVGFIDNDNLAVLTNQDHDTVSLVKFNFRTQRFGDLLYQHPVYDLVGATVSNGKVQSVSYVDHGMPKTDYIDSSFRNLSDRLRATFPSDEPVIADSSRDFTKLLVALYSSDNPGSFYYFDTEKDTVVHVGSVKTFSDETVFSQSENLVIPTIDGEQIEATLNLPQSNSNGVLLVYPHGGPVGVRDYSYFDEEVQFYTSRGYAVLKVNFRGSKGFGTRFLETGKGQFGQLIEQDITAAVSFVEAKYDFENKCSIGSSYGGYSAMMLAIKHPDDYQCIVSMYGIYDLLHLFNASNFKTSEEFRNGVAEVVGNQSESLKEVSPFFVAEAINAPVLLIAGTEDERADFEQANRMKYRLNQLGKDFEYLFYQGVGHGQNTWSGTRHQAVFVDDYIRRTLDIPRVGDNETRRIFGEDLSIIAQSYKYRDTVPDDIEKSVVYSRMAAEYGDAQSAMDAALDHIREDRIKEALALYQQALDAGHPGAGLSLGHLYHAGESVPQDYQMAFHYYEMDLENGNDVAELFVGRAYCLGEFVEFSITECVNRVFMKNKSADEVKRLSQYYTDTVKEVVRQVSWSERPKGFELDVFLNEVSLAYSSSTLDIELSASDAGIIADGEVSYRMRFDRLLKKGSHYKIEESTNIIPATIGTRFGAELKLEGVNGEVSGSTLVKVRWTPPASLEHQQVESLSITQLSSNTYFFWELASEEELTAGQWKLEVFSMDETPLYSQTFELVNTD